MKDYIRFRDNDTKDWVGLIPVLTLSKWRRSFNRSCVALAIIVVLLDGDRSELFKILEDVVILLSWN